jgi:diketogulonate reductase-like aldo/keto reductase
LLGIAVLEELGITYLETVLLSVPEGQEDVASVRPLWEALESMVHGDKVLSLGVAEFSKDQLEALYEWAAVRGVMGEV